jgi:CheY-like chemotaxis protein
MKDGILVAEDSKDDAYLIQHAFNNGGWEIELQVVRDGAEAIEYLQGTGLFRPSEVQVSRSSASRSEDAMRGRLSSFGLGQERAQFEAFARGHIDRLRFCRRSQQGLSPWRTFVFRKDKRLSERSRFLSLHVPLLSGNEKPFGCANARARLAV